MTQESLKNRSLNAAGSEAASQKDPFFDLGPEEPSENEVEAAKALLQSMTEGGDHHHEGHSTDPRTASVYEHMVSVTAYLLEHQPSQGLDQFEEISRIVRREYTSGGVDRAREDAVAREEEKKPSEAVFAAGERSMFSHPDHVWNHGPLMNPPVPSQYSGPFEEIPEETECLGNICEQFNIIAQSGIGLGREELVRVLLSMRQLWRVFQDERPQLRFWGKIFGRNANYYIVEAEVVGEEPSPRIPGPWDNWRPPKPATMLLESYEIDGDKSDPNYVASLPVEKRVLINLPKNKYKAPIRYPPEARGKGLNRWEYIVSNTLTEGSWVRLPMVWPEQVVAARQSVYLFTGDLEAEVGKLPCGVGNFPGDEAHYLRAQIARISSGTHAAPDGLFTVDDEAVEEGEKPENLVAAEGFEPPPLDDLLKTESWVHDRPYIYSNGLINWMSRKKAAAAMRAFLGDEEGEGSEPEEMGEEGEEEEEEEETEEGPDLLSPLNEDLNLAPLGRVGLSIFNNPNNTPLSPWSARPSTVMLPPNCAITVVSSSRWPGAYALARQNTVVNIYLGWANKIVSASYQPPRSQALAVEFDDDSVALRETVDPTVMQEEEVRLRAEARKLARLAAAEEPEDEEEEGGEESEG